MGEIAAGLGRDGVEVSLDRWIARLGKQLPEFMENLVYPWSRWHGLTMKLINACQGGGFIGSYFTARTKNLDPGVIIDAIMVPGTLMVRSGIASTILGSIIMAAAVDLVVLWLAITDRMSAPATG